MKMKTLVAVSVLVFSLLCFYGKAGLAMEQTTEAVQAEKQKMLFLCYWELNSDMPTMQHVQLARKLTDAGLFPPEGVEIIRFDKTASGWGVTLFTAESAQAAFSLVDLWKVAGAGFFKKVKVSPAMPVKDASANAARLYKLIKEAEAKMKEQ